MASNTRTYPDITDFEDYPDWIELHNPSDTGVSLDGIFLSDNATRPLKWRFPAGATIPANGYLVVIADGNDAGIGETYRRDYWPFHDFTTEKYHTNFSLSSAGESVILTSTNGSNNTPLIDLGATWKYLDDGSSQATQWRGRLFDDSIWSSGPAPLGYGDEPTTEISFGGDEDNRHITTYFRHTFTVSDPLAFDSLLLSLQVDDGGAIYLNGNEIVRQNLPEGELTSNTPASSFIPFPEEAEFTDYTLSPEFLVAGNNVLAVEVHQGSGSSVDVRFDLSLQGAQFIDRVVIDSIDYTQQVQDVPLARSPVDDEIWVTLDEATPGAANAGREITDPRLTSEEVAISPAGGLYDDEQLITLTAPAGEIRYTMNGDEPGPQSSLYSDPISVTEPTVIRARVYEQGKVPGNIMTQTFLIGEEFNGLPILSVVAEAKTLFDAEIGIYNNAHEPLTGVGPAVYKGKDAPGHLEFFPPDGSEGFAVNGGFRMGGENNWSTHFQRALNFSLRGKYGDDQLQYDLFPETSIATFTSLTLREGGDDYGRARLSDAIFDSIARGRLDVETNKSRPAVVFINGRYWGHYNIRDRWDDNWFFQHHKTNDGEYDHIAFDNPNQNQPPNVENGSNAEWNSLFNFIRNSDLTDDAVYDFIESRMEIDSFIDFIVCESWGNNTSWTGNREAWKDQRTGSKWRWFIPDMDRTFRDDSNEFGDMLDREQILRYLKNNARFRARLAQRYAVHLSSTFAEDRIHQLIDTQGAEIAPEITRTDVIWGGVSNLEEYNAWLVSMKEFATARLVDAYTEIQTGLGIQDEPVTLTLFANPLTGSSFEIQGVPVEWGVFKVFPNLETTITAIPPPGFRFSHWVGVQNANLPTLNLTLGLNATDLEAVFVPVDTPTLGGTLTENRTLSQTTAPYVVEDDLIVPEGITLTLHSGVTLEMAEGRNIRVMGTLNIIGSNEAPVTIRGRNGKDWGGLSFENPSTTSSLSHFVLRNATRGKDSLTYPSAISGLNATLDIEFLDIGESRAPLFFRGGSLSLRDSIIDIPLTGDGLNVKQGAAETIRCTFTGNDSPDTDAIDYDGVVDGLIKDCRIYQFQGFNSDGIDTGEQCVNCLIEGNTIFFNADKGISVGQGSSVILRNNLIVGSLQGVGVKDTGSTILIDQNTFVDCTEGVAVFEKNFGGGGGNATVTNCIFSECDQPTTVDSLSTLTVSYSLSDTLSLPGENHLQGSPLFVDAAALNFELTATSPAIDTGDPNHANDPDGSRADMGALYAFSPEDYPFSSDNSIVVNEVLANSGSQSDWIELHNRTQDPIDIGGWFLSDNASQLSKYRIPIGTIIPGGGFLAFYQDTNFGIDSIDPNQLVGFALSDTGETVYLTSAENDKLTNYRFKEKFGASLEGESLGYYFKQSTNSYNFIAQAIQSPSDPNVGPRVGPIVISEIMYQPSGQGDAEYFELLNVTDSPVTFFDPDSGLAWRIGNGVDFEFPADSPITLAPGQRIILTRNADLFSSTFSSVEDTLVLEWLTGKLSNGGETLQLERPGPVDDFGNVSYVRVDRVNYDNDLPWDTGANGTGLSLNKIVENDYGNDFINWDASTPTPGGFEAVVNFDEWAFSFALSGMSDDDDGDRLANLLEYALGTDPTVANVATPLDFTLSSNAIRLSFANAILRPDLNVSLQASEDLLNWTVIPTSKTGNLREASLPRTGQKFFYRLHVRRKP